MIELLLPNCGSQGSNYWLTWTFFTAAGRSLTHIQNINKKMGEQRFIFNHTSRAGCSVRAYLLRWWITPQNWGLPEMSVRATQRETFSCLNLPTAAPIRAPPPGDWEKMLGVCLLACWPPPPEQRGVCLLSLCVGDTYGVLSVREQSLFQDAF